MVILKPSASSWKEIRVYPNPTLSNS